MAAVPFDRFRIFINTPRPDESHLAPFRTAPAGNVCDAMDRMGAMDFRIKPLDPASRLCSPALHQFAPARATT